MQHVAWPRVRGDLPSTRRGAALFLENLHIEGIHDAARRQYWLARWARIGKAQCLLAEMNLQKGAFEKAIEAWLCGLTAFELAKRLVGEEDQETRDISAKIEAGVHLGISLQQKLERVQIDWCDEFPLAAYYLRAGASGTSFPAVLCISREEEPAAMLLGRLLPVVAGRSISLLVVSYDDVSKEHRSGPEIFLSGCLDYLLTRPDVDARRIGIFGEGLSAVAATSLAASDRRVAAAVCDGGHWNWTRVVASVDWMTNAANVVDDDMTPARRLRLIPRFKCPVLVVPGGRSLVSVSDALKLQADCAAAGIDLELSIPKTTHTPIGEIENFVTSDDDIFGWLQHRLTQSRSP